MRWLNLGKLRNRGKIWHGQPCGDCGQEEGINGLNGNGKNEVLIKKKMYLKNKDYIRRITEWINIMDNVFREYKIKSRKNLNHKEMNKETVVHTYNGILPSHKKGIKSCHLWQHG